MFFSDDCNIYGLVSFMQTKPQTGDQKEIPEKKSGEAGGQRLCP